MNTQANDVSVSFVESFEAYAADSKSMGELKARLEDARKILEPVIRAHKIAPDDNKAWKEKRAIFYPLVERLEWPINEDGSLVTFHPTEDGNREKKRMDARVAAWLGVIRTCLEYQILPTDKNADRLRKARTWTALSGNGKPNPNWVDPNAPKIEAKPVESTPVQTVSAPLNALALATMQPGANVTITQPQTPPKVPSVKPTTPQKSETPIHPISSNVSSTDAPISSREHFASLWMQLSKNDTFKLEFVDMMTAALEVSRATLTNVMWQSAEQIIRGTKG